MTDKQKEALKIILDLHRNGDIETEQVVTVIDAITDNTKIEYYPWNVYPYCQKDCQPYDITWQTVSSNIEKNKE